MKVRGQDEGIKTDKGTYNSPEEGRNMAPTEVELGRWGPQEHQRSVVGEGSGGCLGDTAKEMSKHPDVYGSFSSLQVVCQRKEHGL